MHAFCILFLPPQKLLNYRKCMSRQESRRVVVEVHEYDDSFYLLDACRSRTISSLNIRHRHPSRPSFIAKHLS